MNTLGDRLRHARKSKGYTQISLAEVIGVSRGVIYNLEKTKTEPQMIVINAICQTLDINKEWLLSGAGDMEKTSYAYQSAKTLSELYDVVKGLSEDEQLYLLDTIKAMKERLNKDN
ncbi:MAG TPA: helix-turn-helix transcriptional regulator [Thermoclostridium sp.]|nr:helix-turn-helix transcriptional regulator [Thermoclostridium sp.]